MKAAAEEGSDAHRKLYWFQVKCFQVCNHQTQLLIHFPKDNVLPVQKIYKTKYTQAADTDRDGMVSMEEFDKMMDVATAAQIRLGLPAPFPTKEERIECFKVNH